MRCAELSKFIKRQFEWPESSNQIVNLSYRLGSSCRDVHECPLPSHNFSIWSFQTNRSKAHPVPKANRATTRLTDCGSCWVLNAVSGLEGIAQRNVFAPWVSPAFKHAAAVVVDLDDGADAATLGVDADGMTQRA